MVNRELKKVCEDLEILTLPGEKFVCVVRGNTVEHVAGPFGSNSAEKAVLKNTIKGLCLEVKTGEADNIFLFEA